MNVPKKLLGRVVSLQWKDPNSARGPLEGIKKGRLALATWVEYGTLHDITDGVVLIVHSYASSPGEPLPDEVQRTAIPEDLVEKITVYQEEAQA